MNLREYLESWDEPLNEGFFEKISKNFKKLFLGATLGILLLATPSMAHSEETQQVEQVVNNTINQDDIRLFSNWIVKNNKLVSQYHQNGAKNLASEHQMLMTLSSLANKHYENTFDAKAYMDGISGKIKEITKDGTRQQLKGINLLKEGKTQDFAKHLGSVAEQNDQKVLKLLQDEINKLKPGAQQKTASAFAGIPTK